MFLSLQNCSAIVTLSESTTWTYTNSIGGSGTFYDTGGAGGNYYNNEDNYWQINCASGSIVTVVLNYVSESGYDYFYFYNGASTGNNFLFVFENVFVYEFLIIIIFLRTNICIASQIGTSFYGSGSKTITSNSNQMLMRFRTDYSVVYSGFTATYYWLIS